MPGAPIPDDWLVAGHLAFVAPDGSNSAAVDCDGTMTVADLRRALGDEQEEA